MDWLNQLDGTIMLFVQEYIRQPFLDPLFIFLTSIGDGGIIWFLLCVLLLPSKRTRPWAVLMALSLAVSFILNGVILKSFFTRPRPFLTLESLQVLIPEPGGYSFPSSHASTSLGASVMLYKGFPKRYGVPILIVGLLIAFSRVYVGVHYLSDVTVGALEGTLVALLIYHYRTRLLRISYK